MVACLDNNTKSGFNAYFGKMVTMSILPYSPCIKNSKNLLLLKIDKEHIYNEKNVETP